MKKFIERFFEVYVRIAIAWVILALSFDVVMLYFQFTDQLEKSAKIISFLQNLGT